MKREADHGSCGTEIHRRAVEDHGLANETPSQTAQTKFLSETRSIRRASGSRPTRSGCGMRPEIIRKNYACQEKTRHVKPKLKCHRRVHGKQGDGGATKNIQAN